MGKAKPGGDGESYFSKRSRAQLAKDSLMVRRTDESSTDDDISAGRQAATSMPTFVEVTSKVQAASVPGGRLEQNPNYAASTGGRLNPNPNYEGGQQAGVEYAVPYN